MNCLVKQYAKLRTIYLSWDAASWHISKGLYAHIEAHNVAAPLTGGPQVDTAPLPSGAQFLYVIESVFKRFDRRAPTWRHHCALGAARTSSLRRGCRQSRRDVCGP
jgi:hypothetical protein